MDQRAVPLRNGLEWFFGDGRPFKENTMRICCDFHSHTIYGDGRNTPEEMIQAACALGFTDFGISEHGFLEHYAYSETGTFGMDETAYLRYREEMEALKEKYRNRIRIYTGVERDGMGPKQEADYVIGSSHQLFKDGEYVMVDESEEILADAVNRLWKGDWYAMTADYYRQEKQIAELTECDFIGHFDLITKFNQDYRHFDESLDAYLEPALDAMRELNKAHIPFEINTGAMSRGFRKEPYPSALLLRELNRMGGTIMINSDSHRTDTIGWQFETAARLAVSCGFDGYYALLPGGGFQKIRF